MTDYGRGPGSVPWHPEDPLYGDQAWEAQQAPNGHGGYGDWQHPEQQTGWAAHPGGYPDQQHPGGAAPYGWDGAQPSGPGYHPGPGGGPAEQYTGQQPGDPYGTHQVGYGEQLYGATSTGQYPAVHSPAQPVFPQDPYGPGPSYPEPDGGHREQRYGAPGNQPLQGFPHQAEPYGVGQPSHPTPDGGPAGPDAPPEWADEPEEDHPFFNDAPVDARETAGYEPDDPEEEDGPPPGRRSARRGKQKRKPKRRSGVACLVVAVVLSGAVGGAGYLGYQFWQEHFGAAPDFSGQGSGEARVEIPEGAGTGEMGRILKEAGVVKSVEAFVEAAGDNPKGGLIQPGTYTLKKKMSGAAAVKMMVDPASRNVLTIPEGWRASQIYAAIDKKLSVKSGTTAKVAAEEDLGVPSWMDGEQVEDPNEGFLFPAQYSVSGDSTPEEVLRQMVARAKKEYGDDLEAQAEELDLDSPRQLITVASLVQAEGKYKHDFEKVARVVYNRLEKGNPETNGRLDFDSTYNYAKKQSTLDLPSPSTMRQFDHPYNTYSEFGLPPGPIGNPGAEALEAALHPAKGNWYFFVSISADNTVFSETYAEHQRNVEKYNEQAGR
ncbi:endolytic transglycosylase MltG [Streptomyces sp. TP-A0874]|uniref:endolytic transglycosylase MltG n=1 Tax=Streptomyces sp. TP-A0874 TaxID=549819 RepID=UPI000852C1A0|nr:endolytic transglycosylase MltG [Streptomyces sp. TP-A0874]